MDYTKAQAAADKSGGRVVVLTAWSAPTTAKEFKHREESAADRAADHRPIGRVQTTGESYTDEKGRVVFKYRIAGQLNRDLHAGAVYLNKAGEPCVDLVISAPVEYGITTFCKYAGKQGSACEKRAKFHAHRSVNLTRLTSWLIAGEEQVEQPHGC